MVQPFQKVPGTIQNHCVLAETQEEVDQYVMMRFDPKVVNKNNYVVIGKLSAPSYATRLHQRRSNYIDQILNKFKYGGDGCTALLKFHDQSDQLLLYADNKWLKGHQCYLSLLVT